MRFSLQWIYNCWSIVINEYRKYFEIPLNRAVAGQNKSTSTESLKTLSLSMIFCKMVNLERRDCVMLPNRYEPTQDVNTVSQKYSQKFQGEEIQKSLQLRHPWSWISCQKSHDPVSVLYWFFVYRIKLNRTWKIAWKKRYHTLQNIGMIINNLSEGALNCNKI